MRKSKLFIVVIVSISFLLLISYLLIPFTGSDSGFYLAVAKDFYEGKVYFKEIGVSYNPLSIITFGIPFLFSETPNYSWHLIINFSIIFSSAVALNKILNTLSKNRNLNTIFSLFFVLLCLVLDGRELMLEPLSIFFQLLAFYIYLSFRKDNKAIKLFFVGVCISLSFLSKQYGLFIALPIGIDLLINLKSKFNYLLKICLGFIIPIGVFFIYLYINGVEFSQFVKYILGVGFELDQGNGTGQNYNFLTYSIGFVIFFAFNLYILIIPKLLLNSRSKFSKEKLIYIYALVSSFLVLFFASFLHYFQYVAPYLIIFTVYLLERDKNSKYLKSSLFLVSVSIIAIGLYSIISFGRKTRQSVTQKKMQAELLSCMPIGSQVYFDGLSPSFYYLCNYKSINLEKIGYTFPGYFYPKTIIKNLNSGAYIVASKDRFDIYKEFIPDCTFKSILINTQEYFIIQKNKKQ